MANVPTKKFNLQQRKFILETYIKHKSIKKTQLQFTNIYKNIKQPSSNTIKKYI